MYAFGSGSAWGTDSAANPTPNPFGTLQECTFDFSFNNKELFGQYKFPVAVGQGTGKIGVKLKFARLTGRILNNLFFNNTKATGQTSVSQDEAGTVPATPFQITVANSATWTEDLGVKDATTGLPLVRVASGPATGQYSVAAGVYTFATADAARLVKIDYEYSISATGEKISIANQLLGAAATFKTVFTQIYGGIRHTVTLNSCVSSKLSPGSKLEDFMMPEMDCSGFADAGNNIGTWSLGEAS